MTATALTTESLLGIWQLVRCVAPLEIQPGTQMHFAPDGSLTYLIPTADAALRISLRWRLDGGVLHTTHEDGTNPVAVPASLGPAEVLAFDFDGLRAFFLRSS